jgi:predicted GNAT family acetyltransferase
MEILHQHINSNGIFYIQKNDRQLAELSYTLAPDHSTMVINHTEVTKELQGERVGQHLVAKAVEYARLKNLKILPLCTFAAQVLKRHSAYHDVLID